MTTPSPDAPDGLAPALARRLATEPADVRRALTVLGEVLSGGDRSPTTANGFVETHLRMPHTALVSERVDLTNTRAVSVGAALADLVDLHAAVLGPVEDDEPPTWQRIDLLDEHVSVPTSAAAFFPAGTATDADVVVQLAEHEYEPQPASLRVLSRPGDHAAARTVADALLATARRDKGFYRGRVLHADAHLPLKLKPTALGPGGREDLVLPAHVWTEIDANVAALTSRADLLRRMGLGTNRGVLLAGPPGVGKSALSRVVPGSWRGSSPSSSSTPPRRPACCARSTGRRPTSAVRRRPRGRRPLPRGPQGGRAGDGAGRLPRRLDGTEEYRDVLTLASTNDPSALDAAATRSARFDAVVHLAAPDREACEAILRRLFGAFGEDGAVDCAVVAAHLPPGVTGADLREIVRRTVLGHGEDLGTEAVLQVVRDGRWQPAPLTGNYL